MKDGSLVKWFSPGSKPLAVLSSIYHFENRNNSVVSVVSGQQTGRSLSCRCAQTQKRKNMDKKCCFYLMHFFSSHLRPLRLFSVREASVQIKPHEKPRNIFLWMRITENSFFFFSLFLCNEQKYIFRTWCPLGKFYLTFGLERRTWGTR